MPEDTEGVVNKINGDGDVLAMFQGIKHPGQDPLAAFFGFVMVSDELGWVHARNLSKLRKLTSMFDELRDADGRRPSVRALRVNCKEFAQVCADQGVTSYPSLSLYRRGMTEAGKKSEFRGHRSVRSLFSFLRDEAQRHHLRSGVAFHNTFKESCRVTGSVEVARVPGILHFEARPFSGEKDASLNPAFTNVSHKVYHLSFGENAVAAAERVAVTVAREEDTPVGIELTEGMVVSSVAQGSPARKAGVRAGWVLLEVAGKPVQASGFSAAVQHAGSRVDMVFMPGTAGVPVAPGRSVAPVDGRSFITERFH